jgi:hypothetical protein
MTNFGKLALSLLALPSFLLASSTAFAITTPAECGKFDFNENGLGCEVKVEGGCAAECRSINFVAGCTGGCTLTATSSCTNNCGVSCIAQCDPSKLDCVAGCHTECEQPFTADCKSKHPERDCVADAQASCTDYCRSQCQVQPSNCTEHCDTCCSGACTSNANMDCDIQCYAKLEGGCKVACTQPTGGLFCNGQYVNASDVQSCINALVAQGLEVNVSARGECTCTLSGCDCGGDAQAGGLACAAAPSHDSPFAPIAIAVGMAAASISVARRRNRKNG